MRARCVKAAYDIHLRPAQEHFRQVTASQVEDELVRVIRVARWSVNSPVKDVIHCPLSSGMLSSGRCAEAGHSASGLSQFGGQYGATPIDNLV